VIQREISRVLVLNLSGENNGAHNTGRISLPLTQPSLLSEGQIQPDAAVAAPEDLAIFSISSNISMSFL